MVQRGMKSHVETSVDYGQSDTNKVFTNKAVETRLTKVEALESAPAVLNAMSKQGWTLV